MKKIKGLKIEISLDAFEKLMSERRNCNNCEYRRDFKPIKKEKIKSMIKNCCN